MPRFLVACRALQRDVDRLPAAAAVHDLGQARRCRADQRFGQGGAGQRREVVVADVEALHGGGHRGGHLGVAVTQVVRAAVEVHVDEALALDVIDEVALPAVDDQRDARVDPELGLVRVPELLGLRQHVLLGSEGDQFLGHGHLQWRRTTNVPVRLNQISIEQTDYCQAVLVSS